MRCQNLKIKYCVTSKHTEFKILCLVNKTRVLLLFTFVLYWYNFKSDVASSVDDVIYGPIESVYKVPHKTIGQRKVIPCFTLFVNK